MTVYTRQGCGLCAAAERVVLEVAEGRAVVRLVDIDQDPELVERYTVRVPVVAIDGRDVFAYEVPPRALRRALRRARFGLTPGEL